MIMRGGLGPHRHELQLDRHRRLAAPRGARAATTSTSPPRATTRPALYAVLIGIGRLAVRAAPRPAPARRAARPPRRRRRPRRCNTNTGSLGMGDLEGEGLRARRAAARRAAAACSCSPATASCRRGSSGSRSAQAANERLRRDHRDRRPQQDPVRHVGRRRSSDLGDLEAKVRAFGWAVGRCDGHDIARAVGARSRELEARAAERPKLLVADTVKGAGVGVHGAARPRSARARRCTPTTRARRRRSSTAARWPSCAARLDERLERLGAEPSRLERDEVPPRAAPREPAEARRRLRRGAGRGGRRARSGSSRSTPTSTSTPA